MRFMLLIYQTEGVLDQAGMEACYRESAGVARDLNASGKFLAAAPLLPVSAATSVKVRDGKPILTDGPFAETREQLGGYFLIDADTKEEAIEIAMRIPGAKVGTVEVRPVLEVGGVPEHDEIVALRKAAV